MLTNTCITLETNGVGPSIVQRTVVASPCGVKVNSVVLWPSKGRKKSSLIDTLVGAWAASTSMRPAPTSLLPSQT